MPRYLPIPVAGKQRQPCVRCWLVLTVFTIPPSALCNFRYGLHLLPTDYAEEGLISKIINKCIYNLRRAHHTTITVSASAPRLEGTARFQDFITAFCPSGLESKITFTLTIRSYKQVQAGRAPQDSRIYYSFLPLGARKQNYIHTIRRSYKQVQAGRALQDFRILLQLFAPRG